MRYIVPGIPAGKDRSAFTPNMTMLAGGGAQSYKGAVSGQPGTMGIPVDNPGARVDPGPSAQAMMGYHRSSDAPNQFFPNIYYQRALTNSPQQDARQIRVYSDNMLPVPAVDPRGIPSTQFMPINQRGVAQLQSLPNLVTWPSSSAG
jgi:hypothetical protein